MTLEEAKARIAELEAENKRLSGLKVEQRSVLPVEAKKIAPFLFNDYGRPYEYSAEINGITHALRMMCYPTVRKERYYRKDDRKIKTNCAILLTDMTVEQYQDYLIAMRKILDAIAECRRKHFVENERGTGEYDGSN